MNKTPIIKTLALAVALAAIFTPGARAQPTNVLIIMPDDLSYNDYSYYNHRTDAPRTPHIDRLAGESVRLTDFHVAPTCSPSRAQLMTGRYDNACGVWHTVMGRYFLHADEVTMADVFKTNGYRTALFGKWHLGESYPFRPKDRGFEHVDMIHGGGIDQQPGFWGNRNTLPSTVYENDRPVLLGDSNASLPGEPERPGIPGAFSTNYFTTQAMAYMKARQDKQEPFFTYLAYNVAHIPSDMPPDARQRIDAHTATIENMDKNVGRILKYLDDSGLAKNTLLIVILGDNGMANDRFRGDKATEYEAGHRVPCFVRWPSGGYAGTPASSRDVSRMVSEMDLLPTLMDVLKLHDIANRPSQVAIAGRSIKTLLNADQAADAPLFNTRVLVVDNQRLDDLVKYREACVMQDEVDSSGRIVRKWRLMRSSASKPWELYDVQADAHQQSDLLKHPETDQVAAVVESLQSYYEDWWQGVSARATEYARPIVGSKAEPTTCLYAHDWHMAEGLPPWNQTAIASGMKANGFNAMSIAQAGTYTFDLRRWPREIAGETTLTSQLRSPIRITVSNALTHGKALPIHSARIRIWNDEKIYADERQAVKPDSSGAVFNLQLPAGPAMVQTWFYDQDGAELGGAYYVYANLANDGEQP